MHLPVPAPTPPLGLMRHVIQPSEHFLLMTRTVSSSASLTKSWMGQPPSPPAWTRGKLCFIPTCARPARPQDLRPISLTPCLGKIFARILVNRLSPKFPSYRAGQHACRKGSQALEAVTCAQASMKLFRAATGRGLHLMKLDVSQAFDTLSHHAIWRFFLETDRCAEASVLWDLCRNTCVDMQLGSESWSQHLGRGVLQGTSFLSRPFCTHFRLLCLRDSQSMVSLLA